MGIIGTSLGNFIKNSERLLTKIDANKADFPHLEAPQAQLVAMVDGAKEALVRQGTFKGQSQQATRDLEAFLKQGRDLVTRLRNGIRSQYGTTTEKLVEFGLSPRRPQGRTKAKTAKQAKAKAPTTATPSSAPDAGSTPEGTSNKPSAA